MTEVHGSSAHTNAAPAPAGTQRLLANWVETGRAAGLGQHLSRFGPLPLPAYRGHAGRERLIRMVEDSGLTGRGGAWFPTGRKLHTVANARQRAVVVGNGCEGEAISEKDHALLTVAPHLVLDGLLVAAHAVAADEAILCVHRNDPLAATVAAAIAERVDDPLPIRVVEVPDRYVSSEESALVNFINTGEARPTAKPPRVFERGVRGRPTAVDNVETLAHLALIARFGPDWFRGQGTATAPGTSLFTLAGAVGRPGVHELPLGLPLAEALRAAGGVTEPIQATLLGGYGGTWVTLPEAAGWSLAPTELRAAGAALGVGVVFALPVRACGLMETARALRYLADESARQCGPCMFGLPAIATDFADLAVGRGRVAQEALDRLRRRLNVINGRGACAHPDGAVRLATSALRVFGPDVAAHAAGRPCPFVGDPARLTVPAAGSPGIEGWR
jgi:NADH:ubiquinone oxidoreductase subunit F (NADH-binding)